ncbi:fatty-acid--CoA ligase FadD5 [Virgisporangium ochraceum]|uniref:Long-chain-fatty-acid--CoA ligase n=1 Tax=Virgisporangium ochraceum TaxID=65505 RepID=A0A8J3ZQP3_9ACTN|nr:AMP-binding protein [Virgisporangium ochraceum]GIJ68432.1 long-chain-fatty-acid--CoA ligase [Virgisporangium ochraceum]
MRFLARVAARVPDRTAVRHGSVTRTYAELFDHAARFAGVLAARGLRPGDRVALMFDNRVEALECYLGCLLGGFTAVHVNDRLRPPEVAAVLDDARPALFVSSTTDADLVVDKGFAGLLDSATPLPAVVTPADTPGIVGYTSGTTGTPKGVVHTYANLARIVRHMPVHYGLRPGSRCAFTGTFSFVAGIWGVLLPHLFLGGEVSFMAGLPADEWVDRMVAERSQFTYVPSPLAPAFTAEVRRRPEVLASLTGVLHSASALRPEVMADLVAVVGDRFVETWGMTETGAPVTATVPGDWGPDCAADDVHASTGRPVHLASVRVVSPSGDDLPPGGTGELLVSSETLFAGYHDRPQETAEVLRDGWLHTGDVGRVDAAGYVYITDRLKDMVVTGGMNVYPAEVERVLATMPGVAEVAVFGVPSERWGETLVAAVVPAPGATVTADGVAGYCRERLASYKKPTDVMVVDQLPRNAALKVRKPVLREAYLSR